MKVWHAIEVEIARVAESAVTSQLWVAGTTGIEVSEENPEVITLRAYFNAPPDGQKLQAQIVRALRLCDLPEVALRRMESLAVADQDWLAEWKKGYEPIEIGRRLLVTPSWKRDQIGPTERVIIQIDPGMAFGTGTHETTRGCLEMLEKYWRGGVLLDVGTGTGILAIAAIKLVPNSRVVGIDIDPEAIEIAQENATINGVAEELELEVNKVSSFQTWEFDLVLANLTAEAIVSLAAELARVVKPEGGLIVSGILREQENEVRQALCAQKLEVLETKPDQEWVTLALRQLP